MHELTLAVVAIDIPNADKAQISRRMEPILCRPGDPIELRPEPNNEHDPYAIAVFSERGVQVGYIDSDREPMVGKRLVNGEEVEGYCRSNCTEGAEGEFLPRLPAHQQANGSVPENKPS